jgi:hypothetical protein
LAAGWLKTAATMELDGGGAQQLPPAAGAFLGKYGHRSWTDFTDSPLSVVPDVGIMQ